MSSHSQGVLILEQVGFTSDLALPYGHHNGHRTSMQQSCDLRHLHERQDCDSQQTKFRNVKSAAGKRSIFDIFWEQFNAPLRSSVTEQCVSQRHRSGYIETDLYSQRHILPVHLGCYNVYM